MWNRRDATVSNSAVGSLLSYKGVILGDIYDSNITM